MTGHEPYNFPRRIRLRISMAMTLFAVGAVGTGFGAPNDPDPTTAEGASKPIEPPGTIDEIRALQAQITQEMRDLAPTTQPATSPTSQPSEAAPAHESAAALYTALEQLSGRIEQLIALRSQLDELKGPARIEAFAKELASIQERTGELEGKLADPPPNASEEELQKVEAEYQAKLSEVRTRLAVQTERSKFLASIPQQLQEVSARTQKAQVDFQTAIARLAALRDAAKTPAERRSIEQEIRRTQIEASLPAFDESILKLIQERDTILQGQTERRLPLVRTMMVKLSDWRNMLQQIRSRGEQERIEAELAFIAHHPNSVPAYERTYWELKLLAVSGREEMSKREKAFRDRYVAFSELDPKQEIPAEEASWELLMESLERRSSTDIREMWMDVREAIRSWREKLTRIRRLLDQTVDQQREITNLLDDYEGQLGEKAAAFNQQVEAYVSQHPGETRAEKLSQDVVETKSQFTQQVQQFQLGVGRLITRLKEASGMIDSFLDKLEDHRSRLYWRYLYVPARFLWSYRWSETKAEWLSHQERERREKAAQDLRAAADAIDQVDWSIFGLSIVFAAGVGIWVRRRAVRYTEATMQRLTETKVLEGDAPITVSDRFHLFASRYLARTALIVFTAGTALIFVPAFDVTGTAATLVLWGLGFLIALALSEALIRLLFVPGKPRQRLLRCSNVVAAHYRRWGMALWTTTLILATPPLFLTALDLATYSRGYLWRLYEIVGLLIVVIFGLQKQLVIRVVGRPEQVRHRGLLAVVSALYPFLWLGAAALLVAAIAGYAALVAYVVSALVKTIATILIALLAARYLTDLLIRYGETLAAHIGKEPGALLSGGPGGTRPAEPPGAPRPGAAPEEPAEAESGSIALQLAAAILRWAVALTAIVLILSYWGITTVEARSVLQYELIAPDAVTGRTAITVSSVLGAILAVVAAWWISRCVRSVLNTRVYPVYKGLDRGAQAAVNTMLHYFLILLGLYFALSALRVPLGALTVVLGTLGLGIGLGLQPLFVNFISGLMILFERHVRVGDLIVVNGELGEVTSISMRSTAIKTPDGVELVIPNSDFITKDVINWTLQEKKLRGHVKVGVAYGTDVELVKRLLMDLMDRHPLVRRYPPPEVWFMDLGNSSLDFEMVAWFDSAPSRWRFVTQIRYDIVRVFGEHGIEIPFPQRTLTTSDGKPLAVRVYSAREGDDPVGGGGEAPPRQSADRADEGKG